MRPERQNHHPVIAELIDQGLRHLLCGGGDDDAVIRRLARHAGKAVAGNDLDIIVAERAQAAPRLLGERAIALDAHHLARQAREHRGLIARAGAYLEHAMMRPQRQLLGHIGHHIGLADGLPAVDRQRVVGIGALGEFRFDELPARHLVHGPQHRLVADAAPPQRQQEFHVFFGLCVARLVRHGLPLSPQI